MLYETVGLDGNIEWQSWAKNFIAAYIRWAEIKNKDNLEFCNMGEFIEVSKIPLTEFKQVVTTTYTKEGLKSTGYHFVFGWSDIADKTLFISQFE